mgnify:FL=1
MLIKNPVYIIQDILKNLVTKGETVVDATCGNGYDTVFLAQLTGENGNVFAFDIQEQAIRQTKERVEKAGVQDSVTLILEGHQHMDRFVKGPIACAMFNLGFLPGSDHKIQTNWPDTVSAINKALNLLKQGGVVTVIIYYGKDTGYVERDEVLSFLAQLDTKKYNVLKLDYLNRTNDPPIPILIEKNE